MREAYKYDNIMIHMHQEVKQTHSRAMHLQVVTSAQCKGEIANRIHVQCFQVSNCRRRYQGLSVEAHSLPRGESSCEGQRCNPWKYSDRTDSTVVCACSSPPGLALSLSLSASLVIKENLPQTAQGAATTVFQVFFPRCRRILSVIGFNVSACDNCQAAP